MDERQNKLSKESKIQNVRIYETEDQKIDDDWENYEYIEEKQQQEESLLKELEEKSKKIQESILASRKHYGTYEEPLNEDPVEEVKLKKTKIDFVLLGAIFAFVMLFWLIFLRK